jgi:N-hydroxyarylamine O-acetyltransferase
MESENLADLSLDQKRRHSYLRRIDYTGDTAKPSSNILRKLHKRHLESVPFENLDIQLNRPIVLSNEAFYDKIVRQRRGGFCYELNGSFANLLKSLGFDLTLLSARVAIEEGSEYTPEYDHMALQVKMGEESWLADVGFGDSFVEPKRIDDYGKSQKDDGNGMLYKIEKNGDALTLFRSRNSTLWIPQYRFTLKPRKLQEFVKRCNYLQTSPNSHFKRGWVCTRLTRLGRITLTDKKFIVTKGDERMERLLEGRREFDSLLYRRFGISLS